MLYRRHEERKVEVSLASPDQIDDLAQVYRVSRDKSSYLLQVRWLTAVGLYDLRTASNA